VSIRIVAGTATVDLDGVDLTRRADGAVSVRYFPDHLLEAAAAALDAAGEHTRAARVRELKEE
jgi:hypothetical protein